MRAALFAESLARNPATQPGLCPQSLSQPFSPPCWSPPLFIRPIRDESLRLNVAFFPIEMADVIIFVHATLFDNRPFIDVERMCLRSGSRYDLRTPPGSIKEAE
jgi:hypothetical protein